MFSGFYLFYRRQFFVKSISFICIVSLLFISGCQNSGLNSDSSTNNEATKITFWHGINPPENREIFNELLTQFNAENPKIKVEALYVGQPDEQLPKIIAAVAGNQPPDVLWYVPQLTGKLVELQALKPLQEWWNNSEIKAEIDPAMLPTMELDNNIYSVPFATNNAAMFYRPSLFEKVGIKDTPKTWDEFREVAKKLTIDTNNDGKIDQNGALLSSGKGEFTVFVWLPFIFSANGEIIQNNQVNLVSEGTEKALQLGVDLVKEKSAILSAPDRGYELDNFINGKVAMQVTGPWTLAQLKQSGIDYNVFPIPKINESAAVLGGENLFVFKTNSQREEATLKFLEFILSKEFQTQWALKTGYLPINIEAQQSSEYQQFIKENPVIKVFLDQMKVAKSRPIIADYPAISENLGRAIESSLLGAKTPKQALEESQKRLNLTTIK
ncbi:MAG: ABC transporter substrate-binding protein [Cyanobacteria bacterium]|nr:ABC transporter substrate-binding protein [Cyanobacteria bacterium CG_2015-16_32_12]NCO77930.1 ABC transporter substrate-binding protein [Cyanobacteria bacterium CG_2015-22_32_23]NCQ05510.1 ABC transporter substrate-binding protein [Cyanobacteria bacterium CG_2015-09_32_10]NCQ41507.1 ABC transporter substrate-binding protein [Cyanobacteria bacterium CG_2015-04_32_10]NCS83934.1 ABC transporter substrate-binding protein [Cyanobacteria bacterium CG_2015-02_32_10]